MKNVTGKCTSCGSETRPKLISDEPGRPWFEEHHPKLRSSTRNFQYPWRILAYGAVPAATSLIVFIKFMIRDT
jgi:hypothetical protein